MILIRPKHEILTDIDGDKILQRIEAAGRTCYKSEAKITSESARPFVERIMRSGHHSVIEHESISVLFTCDRGVTHEIVRHRIAAYSQESTRYCNYSGGVTFVIPPWVQDVPEGDYPITWSRRMGNCENEPARYHGGNNRWFWSLAVAELDYIRLLEEGWTPQQARAVLPNSLKAEIVMTANLREWRHVLKLRTSAAAHPQMRELMMPFLHELHERVPAIFDDIRAEGK